MAANISIRPAESEKITINLGHVDLGRVDLLVQEGFYANRTDFIRTAIRNQLSAEREALAQSIARHTFELGLRDISASELQAARQANALLHIRVVGLVRVAADVTPDLAAATIGSIKVLGSLQASPEVTAVIKDRIL